MQRDINSSAPTAPNETWGATETQDNESVQRERDHNGQPKSCTCKEIAIRNKQLRLPSARIYSDLSSVRVVVEAMLDLAGRLHHIWVTFANTI